MAGASSGQRCTVYLDRPRQGIEGFGVCEAFHQAGNIRALADAERTEVLDLLFSPRRGAGFTIIRTIVGDGGTWGDRWDGPTPTIEPSEGTWVWTGDEDQIWITREALARGCQKVFASVWSPPAWMKTNGSVTSGGSLREDKYAAFARVPVPICSGVQDASRDRGRCDLSHERARHERLLFLLPVDRAAARGVHRGASGTGLREGHGSGEDRHAGDRVLRHGPIGLLRACPAEPQGPPRGSASSRNTDTAAQSRPCRQLRRPASPSGSRRSRRREGMGTTLRSGTGSVGQGACTTTSRSLR